MNFQLPICKSFEILKWQPTNLCTSINSLLKMQQFGEKKQKIGLASKQKYYLKYLKIKFVFTVVPKQLSPFQICFAKNNELLTGFH